MSGPLDPLFRDALRERRNARFLGELAVREGLRRLRLAIEARAGVEGDHERAVVRRATERVEERVERRPEPIPGYDLLSAPQVIEILPTLDPGVREEVLRYESATRRRSAIVGGP